MARTHAAGTIGGFMLLAACHPAPAPGPAPQARQTQAVAAPAVAVDGEGLRLIDRSNGRTRPIPFGTDRATMLAALAFLGTPDTGTNAECGAGPLDWATFRDGLTLQFQATRFVGWSARRGGGAVTTMAGIGPGSTRAALESAYAITLPESTLGVEFAAGELGGVLDGPGRAARIAEMWAGTTCLFR